MPPFDWAISLVESLNANDPTPFALSLIPGAVASRLGRMFRNVDEVGDTLLRGYRYEDIWGYGDETLEGLGEYHEFIENFPWRTSDEIVVNADNVVNTLNGPPPAIQIGPGNPMYDEVASIREALRTHKDFGLYPDGRIKSNIAIAVIELSDGTKYTIYSVAGTSPRKHSSFVTEMQNLRGVDVDVAPSLALDQFNTSFTYQGVEGVTAQQLMEEAYTEYGQEIGGVRYYDTEPKIFEYLADQKIGSEEIVRIEVYTERHPCLSCGGADIIDGRNVEAGNKGLVQYYGSYFEEYDIELQIYYMDENPTYDFNS